MRCLKAEANTPEGVLSPKAAEYNKQGEWDTLMGLQLLCLGDGHCGGRVGQDGYRLCGKAPGECAAKAHNGTLRPVADQRDVMLPQGCLSHRPADL
jgi:hypothetical protein